MWGVGNTVWVGCGGNDCVETHICASAKAAAETWNNRAETPEAVELAALKADMEAGRLVRVVRCKDCVYGEASCIDNMIECNASKEYHGMNGYCEYGKLRAAFAAEQEGQDG